jgi:hypothetical protein
MLNLSWMHFETTSGTTEFAMANHCENSPGILKPSQDGENLPHVPNKLWKLPEIKPILATPIKSKVRRPRQINL